MGIINHIRKKREERGYSQDYMAAALGITVKTYGRLENGQGRLIVKVVEDISRILEVSPYQLVRFEELNGGNGGSYINGMVWPGFSDDQHDTIMQLHKERIKHLESEVIYLRHILEKKLISTS